MVTGNDVTVKRTLERRDKGIVATYHLSSAKAEPTKIHVYEDLPPTDRTEGSDARSETSDERTESIRFHPDYPPDDWTVQQERLVFVKSVFGDERKAVVLGLQSEEEFSDFEDPKVSIGASEDGADSPFSVRGGNANGESVTEGVREPERGAGANGVLDRYEFDHEFVNSALAFRDRDEPDDAARQRSGGRDASDAPRSPDADADTARAAYADAEPTEPAAPDEDAVDRGSVGSALDRVVEEVRRGELADDQLATLRSELDVRSRSDEVRLEHVQARMDDFAVYVDALEEFIDEHGTGQEIIAEVRGRLSTLSDEVSDLESEVSRTQATRDELGERVDELSDGLERVGDLADDLEEIRDRVAEVDERTARFDEHAAAVETLEGEFEELRGETLADLKAQVEDLQAADEDVRSELEALRERDEQLDSQLETVRKETLSELEELRDDVRSDLESLSTDVEAFNEARRVLLDAFGSATVDASIGDDEPPEAEGE